MTTADVAISAHRGGSECPPAGTYEAYRAAADAGADYVEFDIRRTVTDRPRHAAVLRDRLGRAAL